MQFLRWPQLFARQCSYTHFYIKTLHIVFCINILIFYVHPFLIILLLIFLTYSYSYNRNANLSYHVTNLRLYWPCFIFHHQCSTIPIVHIYKALWNSLIWFALSVTILWKHCAHSINVIGHMHINRKTNNTKCN